MSTGKRFDPSDLDRVERLVEDCMPELLDFFERQQLPLARIDRIFFEALHRLAHRWETIQDHRSWLFETLERLAREELGRGSPPPATRTTTRIPKLLRLERCASSWATARVADRPLGS